ncbi:(2Fe-2S)-binding protein [Streptomyces sp. NPDC050856]|uniref:(2Fe-2S)-binding protein n=1 Tax=Streptomyces sp. NPDC050856 TaxID=3154939 RepID=UPI0033CA6CC5
MSLPVSPPLAGAYRRMAALSPLLRIEVGEPGDGDDWIAGHRLTDPAVLERLVADEERRIEDAYGVQARRDVAATWVLHRYAFTVILAMSGPWYLERRVPRLPPAGVRYGGRTRRLAVTATDGVSCLAGDPLAAAPGVRALDGEEALRAELRAAVAGHLEPVLEAFRPLMRRGARAMWGLITDELAEGLRHLGRRLGDEWAAARAADALLPGRTAPYAGAAGFRPDPDACGEPTRTRVGCCLFYTIRPEDICATCPRAA